GRRGLESQVVFLGRAPHAWTHRGRFGVQQVPEHLTWRPGALGRALVLRRARQIAHDCRQDGWRARKNIQRPREVQLSHGVILGLAGRWGLAARLRSCTVPDQPVLEVNNLTKLYGSFRAVDRVSFSLAKG